jgi:hypothetical protein
MSNYCFTVPILAGGEEKMKQWVRTGVMNNVGHDRVLREAGILREQVWLQHTPMGDFAVASWELEDAEKAFKTVMTSTDPWAIEFRAFLLDVYGVDFGKSVPINEQALDWRVKERVRV